MDKYIPIESTDYRTGLPNITKFHPDVMEKIAGVAEPVQEFLTTLKHNPNLIYLVINAMGAGEYYSSNKNGDFFPEPELARTHSTFVTDAKVYKHHQNKPHNKSYGDVLFSYYHPDMHRVELVVTIDRRLAPDLADRLDSDEYIPWSMGVKIPSDVCLDKDTQLFTNERICSLGEILPGEMVKTHKGVYKEVLATSRRLVNNYVEATPFGDFECLRGTADHPVLVATKDQFLSGKTIRRKALKTEYPTYAWKRLGDLRVGDYLIFRKTKKTENSKINSNIARILGYYIAEGSIIKQRCGRDKKGDMKNMGVGFSFNINEKEYVDELKTLLKGEFNLEAKVYRFEDKNEASVQVYSKELSSLMLELGGEYSKTKFINSKLFSESDEILKNLLGTLINGDGSQDHNRHAGMIRYTTVSKNLARSVRRLCLELSIEGSVNCHFSKSNFNPKGGLVYNVHIPASCSEEISKYSEKVSSYAIAKGTRFFSFDNYTLIPVKSINFIEEPLEVVNLQVEEDESYLALDYISHNCSICGNRSKSISQYCSHLKRSNINKIDPMTGKKAFAINDKITRFFDISVVRVNADRTAYTMKKIASAEDSKKQAMIIKKVPATEAGRGSTPREALIRASQNNMPMSLIKDLTKTADLETLLRTFLGMRVMPTKADFQNIVLYNAHHEDLAKYLNRKGRIFPNTDGPTTVNLPKVFNTSVADKILREHPEAIQSKPTIVVRIMRMMKTASPEQEIYDIPLLTKVAGLYQWYIKEFNTAKIDHGPLIKNASLMKLLYPRNALFNTAAGKV